MCGIFGVINTKEKIDVNKVIEARDILKHRGPDDEGLYLSGFNSNYYPFVALAHRRLSIIDLSNNARQPMISENGRYVIVYNGEIYNYLSIKNKKLKIKNYKTESDTEVILNLYAEYGKECLSMLRGMFAFAIWDDEKKILFAARDRFGIKPFYYYVNDNEFIFSSELKAIKYYKENLTTNFKALDAYLRTGSVPAPLTIYNEVLLLIPGCWIEIKFDKGKIASSSQKFSVKTQKYWKFSDLFNNELVNNSQNSINEYNYNKSSTNASKKNSLILSKKYNHNAKRIIREALLDTVRAHLVADVEVGAFLSGGIDSTSIVSLMRQVGKEKIKTVSIVFPESKFDESKYSRLAAKKYNTEHVEIPFYERDLIEDLDKIFSVMDQPTIDGINTYFVSKAAKQVGLKVVLSGLGGDELFGGYPSFNLIPKYQRIKKLPFVKFLMQVAAPLLRNRIPAKAIHYLKNPDEPNAEYRLVRALFTEEELNAIGWKRKGGQVSAFSHQSSVSNFQVMNYEITTNEDQLFNELNFYFDQYDEEAEKLRGLVKVSYLESCFYMRNQLLRDSDVFSMAHSLELRVPFVDHKLYEAVLPYLDDAYDKNYPKKMLVEAVGDLPDEIVYRTKMGFTFPFEDWIKNGKLKDIVFDRLKNLDSDEQLSLNWSELHWSRFWGLFVINKFIGEK